MTKRHLVTGGSSGIGACLVERLRARGDEVIAPTRAELDLANVDAVIGWARALDVERIDALVHCAGVVHLASVADFHYPDWNAALTVNLIAPAALTSALLPVLRHCQATVLFVNSTAGMTANAAWSAYAASKFGLRAVADSLRAEEPNIRVATVFPGRTATRMQEQVHREERRVYDPSAWIQPDVVAAQVEGLLDLDPSAQIPEVIIRPR